MPDKPTPKSRLSVGLTDSELAELTALKDRHHVSMAWLARQAIMEFISKYREEHVQLPLKLTARSNNEHL